MSNDPEATSAGRERKRLLDRLRTGPWDAGDDGADEDVRAAFRAGVNAWVCRLAWRELFAPVPPAHLVAEFVAWAETAGGSVTAERRGEEWVRVDNWIDWGVGDSVGAPVAQENVLLPTRSNVVDLYAPSADRAEATVEILPKPWPAWAADPAAELDLYCDPGAPPDAAVLRAFQELVAGEWTNRSGRSPPSAAWPRPGLRPGWTRPPGGVGPADLLDRFAHPFADRFARLPLGWLRDGAAAGGPVQTLIRLPDAERVVQTLAGRVFVNHVLIWNRVPQRLEPRDAPVRIVSLADGAAPLVLDARDIDRQVVYRDARWAYGADPALRFTVRPVPGSDRAFEMEWHGAPPALGSLRVVSLLSARWPARAEGEVVRSSDRMRLAVRAGPEAAAEAGVAERLGLSWLAGVTEALPDGAPAVTRGELERLVWRLLPPAARRLAEEGRDAGVPIPPVTPRFRPVAAADGAAPAYPVAVVWLPCRDAGAAAALAHQLRRTAALAEEQCGAWTAVEVRWTDGRANDA